MEIWKAVQLEYFENKYLVSNYGKVKIINGKELNQTFDSKGYLKVHLWKDNKRKTVKVHRLVAIAFIENPENKSQVNHIDGNKTNNCVENLEWNTSKENVKHSYDNDLAKKGEYRHNSKHLIIRDINGSVISQYSNINTLANIINIGSDKLLKTLRNNNIDVEIIDKIDNKLPLDIKLNRFDNSHNYCPIAIYNENMELVAMYSTIATMTKKTSLSEFIGNKANLIEPIRHKKRGKQYKKFYYIKKLSFEDFFTLKCNIIDDYLEIE